MEYYNDDEERVTYDEEREEWIIDSTGEAMGDDEWTWGRNHYEDFEIWFENIEKE